MRVCVRRAMWVVGGVLESTALCPVRTGRPAAQASGATQSHGISGRDPGVFLYTECTGLAHRRCPVTYTAPRPDTPVRAALRRVTQTAEFTIVPTNRDRALCVHGVDGTSRRRIDVVRASRAPRAARGRSASAPAPRRSAAQARAAGGAQPLPCTTRTHAGAVAMPGSQGGTG